MALSRRSHVINGCCVFLRRPSRRGYRVLATEEEEEVASAVRVVVGKERRLFLVDPTVLEAEPFRILMNTVNMEEDDDDHEVFVDVDTILFEHILWLVCSDDCSASSSTSLLQLNLKEIIEFYSQDY